MTVIIDVVKDLSVDRDAALAAIDAAADAEHARLITVTSTQSRRYAAKRAAAERYLSDAAPDDSLYPLIVAEVGITGDTMIDVATAIIANAMGEEAVLARIERVRLGRKGAVRAATTPAAIQAAATINWSLE